MINLNTFKKRSEFIEAWNEREGYIKHLEEENHVLNNRLQEYEGQPQTLDEQEVYFQKFWKEYERVGNVKQARIRFNKLSNKKKVELFKALPAYVKSTHKNGTFPSRKGAESWINNEGWNDEIRQAAASEKGYTAKAIYSMSHQKFRPSEQLSDDEINKLKENGIDRIKQIKGK